MAESLSNKKRPSSKKSLWRLGFLLPILAPILVAVLVYQLVSFDPVPFPMHELIQNPMFVPRHNPRILHGAEKIGTGKLLAAEDIAYDPKSGVIYTGCADGWVKRVTIKNSAEAPESVVVENWVNTGGRPLGLALTHSGEVIIADGDKGLLKVSEDGTIAMLTDEAEGLKFKLTDEVAISKNNGMMYFTDASHKYNDFVWDLLEGRPNGRLLSYDPSTKQTKVIARDLHFANGIALSPDEDFVIFCETSMRRCNKYYIHGERAGSIDVFVDNLPGMPDNIHYDGEGHYWIAILSTENTWAWDQAQKYPFMRKFLGIMMKCRGLPATEKNGGAIVVDLEGKAIERYYDIGLTRVTTGIKIGDYLYCCSLANSYILRLNLTKYPALARI